VCHSYSDFNFGVTFLEHSVLSTNRWPVHKIDDFEWHEPRNGRYFALFHRMW